MSYEIIEKGVFTAYSLEVFELTDGNGNGEWTVVDNYRSYAEAKADYDKATANNRYISLRLEKHTGRYFDGSFTHEVIAERRASR